MLPQVDLNALIDSIAERVAEKLSQRSPSSPASDGRLLLTVEQAAEKLGRTVPALEHMISAKKIPTVRLDRRVQIDLRDLLILIDKAKI